MHACEALAKGDRVVAPLGPSGLASLTIGTIALAGYNIYKGCGTLQGVVRGAVDSAGTLLNAQRQSVKNSEPEPVRQGAMLPMEIYKHIDQTREAADKVAHTIARSFVGHSLIRVGLLDELNFSRTIAMTLRPDVVMPATRVMPARTATATPPLTVAGRGVTINLTCSPTIKDASPDEWVKAARRHADELVRIIDAKLSRRARLELA
jgi:hypothetical protein